MKKCIYIVTCFAFFAACTSDESNKSAKETPAAKKMRVVFDTDANNEVDDQHALAYLLFNDSSFSVEGVTVNATKSGGDISAQYGEALRILQLCAKDKQVPLFKGANKSFNDIKDSTGNVSFDGGDAVDFIIKEANLQNTEPLILIAVGKLTNVALAIKRDPSIVSNIRLVWLGSNYPEPGEYNMENDTAAMNYILHTNIHFELVTVRYGKSSGTDAVKVTQHTIDSVMPGLGPKVAPVMGRHDTALPCFGDYSVNLFKHIEFYGNPPGRALFDMAAVAIVKDSTWATKKEIPCPAFINGNWVEQPNNTRKIYFWENFDSQKILNDFFATMKAAK